MRPDPFPFEVVMLSFHSLLRYLCCPWACVVSAERLFVAPLDNLFWFFQDRAPSPEPPSSVCCFSRCRHVVCQSVCRRESLCACLGNWAWDAERRKFYIQYQGRRRLHTKMWEEIKHLERVNAPKHMIQGVPINKTASSCVVGNIDARLTITVHFNSATLLCNCALNLTFCFPLSRSGLIVAASMCMSLLVSPSAPCRTNKTCFLLSSHSLSLSNFFPE